MAAHYRIPPDMRQVVAEGSTRSHNFSDKFTRVLLACATQL